jgi:2-haloalkanoic acid dehalogenase type II
VSGGNFRAVLFDLLTGLLDSWTLWDSIAGNVGDGRRWRSAYLKNTYAEGGYRPYETLVREAAVEIGRSPDLGERQAARYDELKPWPEVPEVLGKLQGAFRLGIVTNCSEALGRSAASRTGIAFDTIVTAERAGFYKPRPEAYRLALNELGVAAAECLRPAASACRCGHARKPASLLRRRRRGHRPIRRRTRRRPWPGTTASIRSRPCCSGIIKMG